MGFNICYSADDKFAKFQFRLLLIFFYKLCNDNLYNESQI